MKASEGRSNIADTIQLVIMVMLIILTLVISRLPFYSVVGRSMENTFFDGNVLVGDKKAEIHAGDILIIDSEVLDERIIKRCIGLPGDTVEIRDNQMYVNGQKKQEDYIREPMNTPNLIMKLGADEYFVAGDNRNHSTDSREIGCIPTASIEAKVTYNLTEKMGIDYKRLQLIRHIIIVISILYIIYVCIMSFIVDPIREKREQEKGDSL